MFRFNDIVRAEAERYGVLVMDFQNYPITEDPRLWFEDRLHGNELGHQRTAAALAWRWASTGPTSPGPSRWTTSRPGAGSASSWPPTSTGSVATSGRGSARA